MTNVSGRTVRRFAILALVFGTVGVLAFVLLGQSTETTGESQSALSPNQRSVMRYAGEGLGHTSEAGVPLAAEGPPRLNLQVAQAGPQAEDLAAKQARLKALREALRQKEGWRGQDLSERIRQLRGMKLKSDQQ